MSRTLPVALALLALVVTAPLRADEVTLKSGRTVTGVIIQDNDRFIRIVTASGKVLKISHATIEMLAEEVKTGDAEVDARLDEIDVDDADALAEVATWARKRKGDAWRLVAWYAVRLDDDQDTARKLLGHVKVGDGWFTSQKEADQARKELVKQRLKDGGYVRWRGGWVHKDDKELATKDPGLFLKDDDGLWRLEAEVMRERGMLLHGGKWVKAPSESDQEEMRRFEKLVGEDIWVHTTEHYRFYVQGVEPKRIEELGDLTEKIHAWFLKEMRQAADTKILHRHQEFWVLKDKSSFSEWLKHYSSRYSINDDRAQWFRGIGRAVGTSMMGRVLDSDDPPLENWTALYTGSELGRNFARFDGVVPDWYLECWGLLAQAIHCEKILCTYMDRSAYDANADVADKEMDTLQAAYQRCTGLVRSGEDPDLATMNQLETNSLRDDHLAKGLTLIHWLLQEHREKFIKWLVATRTHGLLEAIPQAFPGWDPGKLDAAWRKAIAAK